MTSLQKFFDGLAEDPWYLPSEGSDRAKVAPAPYPRAIKGPLGHSEGKRQEREPLTPVSPGDFFGDNHDAVAPPAKALKDRPLMPKKDASWGFRRQQECFEAARHERSALFFSYEQPGETSGRRFFGFARHPQGLWRFVKDNPEGSCEERHVYEVIPEGNPCHLYFDLEFEYEKNPQVDGDVMTDAVIQIARVLLSERLGIRIASVIELKNFSLGKFSCHLVIKLQDGNAFASSQDAGRFAQNVIARAEEEKEAGRLDHGLLVTKRSSDNHVQPVPFVDLSVYGRNRAWRLPYCSKASKPGVQLAPTMRTFEALHGHTPWWDVPLGPPLERLRNSPVEKSERSFSKSDLRELDWKVFSEALVSWVHKGAELVEWPSTWSGAGNKFGSSASGCAAGGDGMQRIDLSTTSLPQTVAFIERLASSMGGKEAKARSCVTKPENLVAYVGLTGSRFCERIGREHRCVILGR